LQTANKDDPHVQFHIGMMDFKGEGPKQSIQQAIKWVQKASKNGEARAAKTIKDIEPNREPE
jgi:TPR repeat protein